MPESRVRFTSRGMMIAIAMVALSLFAYRALGSAALPLGVVSLLFVGMVYHWGRLRPRWSAWGFWSSAIAINGFVATIDVYVLCLGGGLVMRFAAFFGFSLILGLGSAWATSPVPGRPIARRSPTLALSVVIALSIAPITMITDSWTLKLACLVSRPAMDRLADRVSSGENVDWPVNAGLFTFVGAEFNPLTRSVGLITDPDPSGRSGFVRHLPEMSSKNQLGPFTNLNFNVGMGGGWWYQNED